MVEYYILETKLTDISQIPNLDVMIDYLESQIAIGSQLRIERTQVSNSVEEHLVRNGDYSGGLKVYHVDMNVITRELLVARRGVRDKTVEDTINTFIQYEGQKEISLLFISDDSNPDDRQQNEIKYKTSIPILSLYEGKLTLEVREPSLLNGIYDWELIAKELKSIAGRENLEVTHEHLGIPDELLLELYFHVDEYHGDLGTPLGVTEYLLERQLEFAKIEAPTQEQILQQQFLIHTTQAYMALMAPELVAQPSFQIGKSDVSIQVDTFINDYFSN